MLPSLVTKRVAYVSTKRIGPRLCCPLYVMLCYAIINKQNAGNEQNASNECPLEVLRNHTNDLFPSHSKIYGSRRILIEKIVKFESDSFEYELCG